MENDTREKTSEQPPIDFSRWVFKDGGWQSPSYDWHRWRPTLDNWPGAAELPTHLKPMTSGGGR